MTTTAKRNTKLVHTQRTKPPVFYRNCQNSTWLAFFSEVQDYYTTHDGLRIARVTITHERKDDGMRRTQAIWRSADSRVTSSERKLGPLLADLRRQLDRQRQAAMRLYVNGVL